MTARLYHIRLSAGPYFAVQQINMYWVNQIWTLILIPFFKLQNVLLVANFPPIYACFYWHSSPNRALNDIICKWKKLSFYKSWKKESLHHTSPLKVTYVTMLWPTQSHFKVPWNYIAATTLLLKWPKCEAKLCSSTNSSILLTTLSSSTQMYLLINISENPCA